MLDSEWRTTGTWSLIANHPDAEHARQAARTWSNIAVEKIRAAVDASRRTFMVDQELQAGESEMLQASLRISELDTTRKALEEWQRTLKLRDPTALLDPEERWELASLITHTAKFTPAWMSLLESQPLVEEPIDGYLVWIEQAIQAIQVENSALQERIASLDIGLIEQAQRFSVESRDSMSFSPNIEVERKEDLAARQVRPTSTFIITGGIIGLLGWLLFELVQISISRSHQ